MGCGMRKVGGGFYLSRHQARCMRSHALRALRLIPNACAAALLSILLSSASAQYWKRLRAPDAQLGGVDGTGATFLQTAAEKLDVPDNSQDIV